jgi:hypothetical protein
MRSDLLTGSDALALKLWHDLAKDDPTCGFTNTPVWLSVCSETLGWEPACFAWESEDVVVPFVIRRRRRRFVVLAESHPTGRLGGPIAAGGMYRDLTRLMEPDLQSAALEFLIYPSCDRFTSARWESITHKVHRVTFHSSRNRVWEQASRKCASAARHAMRQGVEIVRVKDGPCLDATIVMHRKQQRGRQARTYSISWWHKLLDEARRHVGLWSAVHEGRVLASLLVGWWNNQGTALVSTSDPQARPLKAGNLLYLAVLEQLEALGLHSVDLGGSRGRAPLESFKESVGARPNYRAFYRHRHPLLRIYQRVFSHREAGRLTAGSERV